MAGRAYAEASEPIIQLSESQSLASAAVLNRENILRMLDSSMAALNALRGDIDENDEKSLSERLERARQGRLRWWVERQAGDWTYESMSKVDLPENPGMMARFFGLGRKPKREN
jgi:hypothetical protein